MRSIHGDVHRRAGIAATHELLKDGHTSHTLTRAVRRGEVIRVRQGHYACPEIPEEQLQAYRVGGRLTGIAGAHAHGLWTPIHARLDVQVSPDARALRTRNNAAQRLSLHPDPLTRVRWTDVGRAGTRSLAGPVDCLEVAIRASSARVAFAMVESALHRGAISRAEWRRLLARLPRRTRNLLGDAAHLSESGGESLLRYDLARVGVRLTQQVTIVGVGRVDFLLGNRLIIEVDGAEFHSARHAFEEDRRRDAEASVRGFRVLRFSYAQVERRDPVVLDAILAAVARGDHE